MNKARLLSLISICLLIPATLYLGLHFTGKSYYLIGTLVILEAMLPFFVSFERRKPQARELVTIAVMCALAVAGRVVIQIPNFKLICAVVMLTGIAFGAEAGFMTGAVSAFASNFFFAQGPWTPWQMLAYGLSGFLAGLLFHKRRPFASKPWIQALTFALVGFVVVAFPVGLTLDTCTLLTTQTNFNWQRALLVYSVGLPHNLIHGGTTAAALLLLSRPMLEKLDRLKEKYGILL